MRLMVETTMRPYQVRETVPGEGLHVRDLWTGADVFVQERAGSRQLVTWDVLVARVHAHADGSHQLEGSPFPLPPSSARMLARTLKQEMRRMQKREPALTERQFFKQVTPVLHLLWFDEVLSEPRPELRTPEGDLYMSSTVEFHLARADEALALLLEHDDFEPGPPRAVAWVEPAPTPTRLLGEVEAGDGTLVLRTMSKERAVRGRARLEAVLGPLRLRRETHEAPDLRPGGEADGPGHDATGDGAAPLDLPEVVALLAQHDREWVDQPVPALDGATPRAAAKNRRLRPRVVDLLIGAENAAARLTLHGTPRDVSWMWK
jgi:hypothetical protein